MDLARAPRRRPLTARKKGSGYENGHKTTKLGARGLVTKTTCVENSVLPRWRSVAIKTIIANCK